jgi:hypothetical protein
MYNRPSKVKLKGKMCEKCNKTDCVGVRYNGIM